MSKQISPQLHCFIACYLTLLRLEDKRWNRGTTGLFTPLEGKEQELYDKLKMWYAEIGFEWQERLKGYCQDIATHLMYSDNKGADITGS